jgi:predicted NAD-dependent protein-ADP-ribosyltransferase YbiA (DUF1768 family)
MSERNVTTAYYAFRKMKHTPLLEEELLRQTKEFLRYKFSEHNLLKKLLATGESPIRFENQHRDTFWGTFKEEGKNHLGKLLVQVRGEFENQL